MLNVIKLIRPKKAQIFIIQSKENEFLILTNFIETDAFQIINYESSHSSERPD